MRIKTFDLLTRLIQRSRRRLNYLRPLTPVRFNLFAAMSAVMRPKKVRVQKVHNQDLISQARMPILLFLAIIILTGVVGYRFYNQPQLAVGTISPVRIEAPKDGRFEDTKTTAAKRQAIRTGIIPILKRDQEVTNRVNREITSSVEQIEKQRESAGTIPFVEPEILSEETQKYLRTSKEWDWQAILSAVKYNQEAEIDPNFWLFKYPRQQIEPEVKQSVAELRAYRQEATSAQFEALTTTIEQARQNYANAQEAIAAQPIPYLSKEDKLTLLTIDPETWQATKTSILAASERILTQGISAGLPPDLIKKTVQVQLVDLPKPNAAIATKLLTGAVRPNLVLDREATKRRAEQAASTVQPVVAEIKRGEVIVDAGEIITQQDFVILDAFGLSRRGINWLGLGLTGLLVSGAVGIFALVQRQTYHELRHRDYFLLYLISAFAPLLAIFGVKYTPLPAIGLLVSSFYGPGLAVTLVLLLTGLITFSTAAVGWYYLLAGAASGLVAAAIAGRLHSREEQALLGLGIGLVQGGVCLIVNLIISATAGSIWYAVLPGAIFYGLIGLAWSIIALGVSPYLERLFDIITPIRLAELSNPNRPLLKRLATETPGTFQHTLFVSSLAEAAARELNCNVELVRAGTLYHDLGKMHDPLGFIENQMGGPNKHDQINDPWLSAQIIKKHVSEGLLIARRYGLPKAVQNFIPEHQGTMLISYFYFQAKHQAEQTGKSIVESDFRYQGPIPQSRETAIVMLADGCEAALRSLKEPNPETAIAVVSKILKARWRDEQLTDSRLRYEELPKIAEVFVRVWQQHNHQRIAYPKAALEPQPLRK